MTIDSTTKHVNNAGYYGRPIIKPPEWTDLIPTYFFSGGMAGSSATLAFAERIAGNDALARPMIYGAAVGTLVSGFCLIADLKRPERFVNMLRIFKPTSPMSVGVYLFSAFGGAALTAAASELTGIAKPLGRLAEGVAGLLGPAMSVYTAVLISDTVVPAWHYGRLSMPALFAATSASSAAAWGLMFAPVESAGSARRLAMIAGTSVPILLERLHMELGPEQEEAYKRGEAETFSHAARLLNITGTACAVFAKNRGPVAKIAGALLAAGGLCERFGVYRAGCNSAKDPAFTIKAQRKRIGSRPQPQTNTTVEETTIASNGKAQATEVSSRV